MEIQTSKKSKDILEKKNKLATPDTKPCFKAMVGNQDDTVSVQGQTNKKKSRTQK
jgi:hypothetical protein